MGWVEVTLGELTSRIVGGGTPSKSNIGFFSGEIPFMTVKDMNIERPTDTKDHITKEALENNSANLIDPDTLIVATRIGLGKIVRALFPTAINQDLKALYFHDELIDKNFIEQWYRNNEKFIQQIGKGTTVKGIRLEVLKSLRIPFPPLNEQKRIVAKIQELQARTRRAREALETIPDLLEQLRQSILAAAFRGDLTKHWREEHPDVEPASELLKRIRAERRKLWEEAELEKLKAKGLTGDKLDTEFSKRRKQYKEPAPADTNDMPELPEKWCWIRIGDIGKVRGGKRLPQGSHLVQEDTGNPYIRAGNLKGGTVKGEILYLSKEDHKSVARYTISSNDAYMTIVGAYIGDAGVVPVEYDGANLTENAAKICELVYLNNQYLGWMLQTMQVQRQIQQRILSAAQGKLALNRITQLMIPLCSEQEQIEITNRIERDLGNIEQIAHTFAVSKTLCDNLDQAVLTKAFRGKLVSQDPNDEPASALLERILKEKTHQQARQETNGKLRNKQLKRSLGGK